MDDQINHEHATCLRALLTSVRHWLIALVVFVCAVPLNAQTPVNTPQADVSLEDLLDRRGSVTFRQTALSEVVFSLGQIWGVNIVAGSDVDGVVSGVFEDAPLSEVLDAVLGANGYGYKLSGRSLIILTLDKIGADDPKLRQKTLRLPGSETDEVALLQAAELLLSTRGRLQVISGNHTVLVVDLEAHVKRIEEFFKDYDKQGERPTIGGNSDDENTITESSVRPPSNSSGPSALYFAPQFTAAADLEPSLIAVLGDSASVSVVVNENRIMVWGTADQLRLATEVIRTLDIPRPQVRISALIYDVELRRGEQLGIDWGKTLNVSGSFGGGSTSSTADAGSGTTGGTGTDGGTGGGSGATAAVATGVAITLGTLQDTLTLGSVIKALDETRGAHLLADPTITVADRNEASIKIVTKIPFQQLTQTAQGGSIGTTSFQEAGITLTVTPRISNDGTIQMKVHPEFSTLVEYINGQPLIDSREAETDVRIADRHTLVIGGLRRKQARDAIAGIPGLMRLKKVGKFFGAHDSGVSESELLVFLRPEIVSPFEHMGMRGSAASSQGNCQLDRIPIADSRPLVPYCEDRHCVYHHPRPNVNRGSIHESSFGIMEMIGGEGLETPLPATDFPTDQAQEVVTEPRPDYSLPRLQPGGVPGGVIGAPVESPNPYIIELEPNQ
jgi:general secretion pathway protein D